MMKRLIFLLAVLVCISISLPVSASIYCVELPILPNATDALEQLSMFRDMADARVATVQDGFAVRVGSFCQEDEAKQLLPLVEQIVPGGTVIAVDTTENTAVSSQPRRVSLRELGHMTDTRVMGSIPYLAVGFPWDRRASFHGSSLVLNLKLSPMLNQRSVLKVIANGNQVFFRSVKDLGEQAVLRIPLDELTGTPASDVLKVEISGYFGITDDRCLDEATGSLWYILSNDSYLSAAVRPGATNIADFFHSLDRHVNIVVNDPSDAALEAALRVSSAVGALPLPKKAVLSEKGRIDPTGSNILIGTYPVDLQVCGSNLYLTPKGAETFVSRFRTLFPVNQVAAQSLEYEPGSKEAKKVIPIRDLNLPNIPVKGIGELTASIPFALADLGGYPENLQFTLNYAHTPVINPERGFLKIKLNGVLINSKELRGDSGIQFHTINLPVENLSQSNLLEVVFAYYLYSGDCHGSYPEMEASVFNTSALLVDGYDTSRPPRLSTVQSGFLGPGLVVMPDVSNRYVKPAMEWAQALGGILRRTPRLTLARQMPATLEGYDWAVYFLNPEQTAQLGPIINPDKAFRVINPATDQTILAADIKESLRILQTFPAQTGQPQVIFTAFGPPPGDLSWGATLQNVEKIVGNVAVASEPGQWYSLEIGRKLEVRYPEVVDLAQYWQRYKLYVIVVAGVLALLLIIYMLRHLTGRKGDNPSEKN